MDVNGDGAIDLMTGGQGFGAIYYFENNGDDSYTEYDPEDNNNPLNNSVVGFNASADIDFADIDDDGDLDAFISGYNYGEVRLFLNNEGGFEEASLSDELLQSYLGYDITLKSVDLDHDGDLDVVVGHQDDQVDFYENIGEASAPVYAVSPDVLTEISTIDHAAMDFLDWDLDGDLDIFVGQADGTISYYENQNEPPQVSFNNTQLSFTEGDAPITLDAELLLSDDGSDDILMAEVAITNGYEDTDNLSITTQGNITASFDNENGILILTGYASLEEYQEVLRTVQYENGSDDPSEETRVISFRITDFDNTVPLETNTVDLTITAINPEPKDIPINIYNAISPNNDGNNDWWVIEGLSIPNTIKIYNRWGDLVKELTDFESSENTPNSALADLISGTYFYKLESAEGTFDGYLVIKK